MDARPGIVQPVFIENTAAGSFPVSAWLERTNASLSTIVEVRENREEISRPVSPYFLNSQWVPKYRRGLEYKPGWSAMSSFVTGIILPSYFLSAGFGSNESICETP